MRKSDFIICGMAFCAAAFALASVAIGREWRLLLVPVSLLPLLTMMGAGLKYGDSSCRRASSILLDIIYCVVATNFAEQMAKHFGGGACFWAPGAMATAVTAAAMLPFFYGSVRHPVLRTVCMSVEMASTAVMPFLFPNSKNVVGLGGIFIVLVYVPIRIYLAVRDRKREVTA